MLKKQLQMINNCQEQVLQHSKFLLENLSQLLLQNGQLKLELDLFAQNNPSKKI